MSEAVDKILLIPRYTAFAGAGTFLTAPMNVREYSRVLATFEEAGALGASGPTVLVYIEESPDLEIWNEIGDSINDHETDTREFQFEWMRLKLVVSGSDPGFTCWCVGDFVRRHA